MNAVSLLESALEKISTFAFSEEDYFFRSSVCALIADLSSVLHLLGGDKVVSICLEYVIRNVEYSRNGHLVTKRACDAFHMLCIRRGKWISPFLLGLNDRLHHSLLFQQQKEAVLEQQCTVIEGLSRVASEHSNPNEAFQIVLMPFVSPTTRPRAQVLLLLSKAILFVPRDSPISQMGMFCASRIHNQQPN